MTKTLSSSRVSDRSRPAVGGQLPPEGRGPYAGRAQRQVGATGGSDGGQGPAAATGGGTEDVQQDARGRPTQARGARGEPAVEGDRHRPQALQAAAQQTPGRLGSR